MKSGVDQKINISGVNISGDVSCAGVVNSKLKDFDKTTALQVTTNQNFICTRTQSEIAGASIKAFKEASIIVSTNYGNYPVLWPRDQRLPDNMANEISKKISSLDQNISQIESNIRPFVLSKPITVYKCPIERTTPPGSWASYGCIGQLSLEASCGNYVYPGGLTTSNCVPIGTMRTSN